MKITIGPRRPDADSELYALIPEACAEWVRYEPDDVDEVTRWYVGEDGTTTRDIRFSPPEEK